MSKAKEYSDFIRYGDLQFPSDVFEKAHPPYCEVSPHGDLSMNPTFPALIPASQALELADWIYDTFGEVEI